LRHKALNDGDTLAEVAAARGYELFEYAPEHLAYNEGVVQARVRPMTRPTF